MSATDAWRTDPFTTSLEERLRQQVLSGSSLAHVDEDTSESDPQSEGSDEGSGEEEAASAVHRNPFALLREQQSGDGGEGDGECSDSSGDESE